MLDSKLAERHSSSVSCSTPQCLNHPRSTGCLDCGPYGACVECDTGYVLVRGGACKKMRPLPAPAVRKLHDAIRRLLHLSLLTQCNGGDWCVPCDALTLRCTKCYCDWDGCAGLDAQGQCECTAAQQLWRSAGPALPQLPLPVRSAARPCAAGDDERGESPVLGLQR